MLSKLLHRLQGHTWRLRWVKRTLEGRAEQYYCTGCDKRKYGIKYDLDEQFNYHAKGVRG